MIKTIETESKKAARNQAFLQALLLIGITVLIVWVLIPKINMRRNVASSDTNLTYNNSGSDQLKVSREGEIIQKFSPRYNDIKGISIGIDTFMAKADDESLIHVQILDSTGFSVYGKSFKMSDLPEYGWLEVAKNIELDSKQAYSLSISTEDKFEANPGIVCHNISAQESAPIPETKMFKLSQAGDDIKDTALSMTFSYYVPYNSKEYLPLYFLIIMVASYHVIKIYITYKEKYSC